jgi:hypothetical protein
MCFVRIHRGFQMRSRFRNACATALGAALLATSMPASASEQFVELRSNGDYRSSRLADDVTDVELDRQLAGACRFNRTWGYDLTNRELWVNGGCGARFKLTARDDHASASGSNVGAAVAAAAAIAGVAILASRHHDDNQAPPSDPYYDHASSGYYPPQPGYRPPPPGYRPASGGYYGGPIRGLNGLCLDIAGGARNGAASILYTCNGQTNQRFSWTPSGELRVAGLCLDVEGASSNNGTRAIAWSCNGRNNQRWQRRGNAIVSVLNGKCLDVRGGRGQPNTEVILWDCNRGANQRWWW